MASANVVIQTAFLGDLILSIPLLKRIKKLNPQDKLIVVCKKGLGDFLIQENIVDQYLEVIKGHSSSYKLALAELKNYDIKNVYCVHRSIRSLLFAAQIDAKKKIGYASFLGFWILDDQIDFEPSWPEVMRLMKILESTDSATRRHIYEKEWSFLNKADDDGVLPNVPQAFSFTEKDKHKKNKKVAIFPGSVWATKKWTKEGFTEVALYLTLQGYQVDLMGGPDEKSLCEQIAAAAPGVRVLAGTFSITQSIQSLVDYDLVISNDSASTHMASYQKVPVITIFGPTVLKQGFRPWSNEALIVENNYLDCRPCGRHGHQQCPLGHHHCMTQLSAASVIKAANNLLTYSA